MTNFTTSAITLRAGCPAPTPVTAPERSVASRACRVYYVYADADEAYLLALESYLRPLERQAVLCGWHRRKVQPGEDWQTAVDHHFDSADVILLLVSPDLLDSKYCYDTEVQRAMVRRARGEVVVVPVIVRPCMWELAPFEKCQPLPSEGRPVSTWDDAESAFLDIATGVRDILLRLRDHGPGGLLSTGPISVSAERYAIHEAADRLEVLLAALAKAGDDLQKANELRAEIGALDQFIQPFLTPRAGDVMGGMELLHPIGSGAFGTVWLSKKPGVDTGERFATKVLHATCLTSGSMLSHFRRGVKAMKYLTRKKEPHPQIVPLLKEDESSLAFTMSYFPGQNLVNVKERGWSTEKKVEVVISLCRAVEYAHQRGVVHRDIKPANIVFTTDGIPILTDFDTANMSHATTLSIDHRGLGSPMFAAPEQLEDREKPDVRFDVYSLGRLLHYMLIERPLSAIPEYPQDLAALSRYPMPLVAIVRRASRRDPAKRYADVASLRAALEAYRRPWSMCQACVNTFADRLVPKLPLVALAFLAVVSTAAFIQHDHVRDASYHALFAEYSRLRADYRDLVRERQGYSDEKTALQAEMEDLVRRYHECSENPALAPSTKNAIDNELLRDWLSKKSRFDEIAAKERDLARRLREQGARVEDAQKRLEEERRRLAMKPIAWPSIGQPAIPTEAPESSASVAAAPLPAPPPAPSTAQPLVFTDVWPQIAAAQQRAAASCAAPAGSDGRITVKLLIAPSGNVTATMSVGPLRTEAEICVLGHFQAIRIEPFEGSPFPVSRSFQLGVKGE